MSKGYVGKAKTRHGTHWVFVVMEEGGREKAVVPVSLAGRSLADEAADEEEALDEEDEDEDEASESDDEEDAAELDELESLLELETEDNEDTEELPDPARFLVAIGMRAGAGAAELGATSCGLAADTNIGVDVDVRAVLFLARLAGAGAISPGEDLRDLRFFAALTGWDGSGFELPGATRTLEALAAITILLSFAISHPFS